MTAKKSCTYGEYGSLEQLLFLFSHGVTQQGKKSRGKRDWIAGLPVVEVDAIPCFH